MDKYIINNGTNIVVSCCFSYEDDKILIVEKKDIKSKSLINILLDRGAYMVAKDVACIINCICIEKFDMEEERIDVGSITISDTTTSERQLVIYADEALFFNRSASLVTNINLKAVSIIEHTHEGTNVYNKYHEINNKSNITVVAEKFILDNRY